MLCGLMLSSCAKHLTFLILIGYFQFAYYDLRQEKQTLKANLPNDEMGNQFVVTLWNGSHLVFISSTSFIQ